MRKEQEDDTRTSTQPGAPIIEMIDDLDSSINHRGKAYVSSTRLSNQVPESQEQVMGKLSDASQSLYCRSSEDSAVVLDDFQLVSVIGKGNFGKVTSDFKDSRYILCICHRTNSTML